MATRRVRLDVAYRGSHFHGFASNPGVPTVEATLVAELERVLRHDVSLDVAGRTDKGVHAVGQVVSFTTDAPHFDAVGLRSSLNKLCAPDIAVAAVELVEPDFHARFSATARAYRYRVLSATTPDPLRADMVWHLTDGLDADAMSVAARSVVGEHDFSAFCKRPKDLAPGSSLHRNVHRCDWSSVSDELQLEIAANAFCHQMVRSLVGAFVAVGRGQMRADEVADMLMAPDRSNAPSLAPPHGLTLMSVTY